uniref:Transposase n=1 Tax=Romanomermis culicivorax TaxID=13658 RepID=A0A915J8B3_ROMCU
MIVGCNFHFTQALNRKLQNLGLREIWNNEGYPGEWIRCLKALAFLPESLVLTAFNAILRNPPAYDDGNNHLMDFRNYFENTWLNGRFPIKLWNQWENDSPRTTNHAEGYHNRLNLMEVRDMNLAPMHNRDQVRVRNLRRGAYQPKPRDGTYVDLDNRITGAKQ